MIKSKPAALPSYCISTHSLIAVVVYTVEVTLPATPPAVSSGKSATLKEIAIEQILDRYAELKVSLW